MIGETLEETLILEKKSSLFRLLRFFDLKKYIKKEYEISLFYTIFEIMNIFRLASKCYFFLQLNKFLKILFFQINTIIYHELFNEYSFSS